MAGREVKRAGDVGSHGGDAVSRLRWLPDTAPPRPAMHRKGRHGLLWNCHKTAGPEKANPWLGVKDDIAFARAKDRGGPGVHSLIG